MEQLTEQRRLFEEFSAQQARFETRYAELEKEFAAARAPRRDYSSKDQAPDPACQVFAKRYQTILAEHLEATRKSIKDSRRLEELTAKQYRLKAAPGAGSTGLKALKIYLERLEGITLLRR